MGFVRHTIPMPNIFHDIEQQIQLTMTLYGSASVVVVFMQLNSDIAIYECVIMNYVTLSCLMCMCYFNICASVNVKVTIS